MCEAEPARISDPAAVTGSPDEIERVYREAFISLDRRIGLFLCLPLASLDKLSIQKHIDQIGRQCPRRAPKVAVGCLLGTVKGSP